MALRELLIYVFTLVILLGLDAFFLGTFAIPQFKAALGDLLLAKPRIIPGILFYLLYAIGLVVFVSQPAAAQGWAAMLGRGALFGLIAYATYDFTNYATLRPWTLKLVLMDLAWGAVVSACAATGGFWVGSALTRLFR